MRFPFLAATVLSIALPSLAEAQDTTTLGFGRLFNNDELGDAEDRWRTASYTFSILRGTEWSGTRPERLGALLEYRLRSEIIAPSFTLGDEIDRPYVGALSLGVHSHFQWQGAEASLGVDVLAIGPQTGVGDFQIGWHDIISYPRPRGVDQQLADAIHIGGTAELAWPLRVSDTTTVRPFFEAQAGIETLVRGGVDVILGAIGHDDLLLRDSTTGQLIRGIQTTYSGSSFIFGADWAHVTDSVYLPRDLGFAVEETRWRARLGVHVDVTPRISLFYGATYLSEEFVGQPEGQIVGGLSIRATF